MCNDVFAEADAAPVCGNERGHKGQCMPGRVPRGGECNNFVIAWWLTLRRGFSRGGACLAGYQGEVSVVEIWI